MDQRFVVLVVCRANVCRSPLAEVLLARYVREAGLSAMISVASAGTDARAGQAMCPDASAWSGEAAPGHSSRQVSSLLLGQADLVLAADVESRASCSRFDPACRPRLFTAIQAARLARYVEEQVLGGLLPVGAPPIPDAPIGRLRWLVEEMDAARPHRSVRDEQEDVIDDVHGQEEHSDSFRKVDAAVKTLSGALAALAGSRPVGG